MNIFDIAIEMEQEGAKFYNSLASKAPTKGFNTIFTMLAEDEVKHEKMFTSMKAGSVPPMVSTNVSDNVKTVFKEFKKEDFINENKQKELYERALDIELKSIEFYSEQLEGIESKAIKKAIEAIIAEERRHYDLIDDIIIMLERPESWVENAEFGVRPQY